MPPKIPLIIMGGSDAEPAELPPDGRDKHPLSGAKGIDVRIDGKPLVDVLLERMRASNYFEPFFIAGPADAYAASEFGAEVIDTDGSFGDNIEAAIEEVRQRYPDTAIAMATCDILPSPDEVVELMQDYWSQAPSDLWFPLVRTDPKDALGESDWKPRYGIPPEPGADPVAVLPGHITVIDPRALRLQFLYRLFGLAYETRNRPLRFRRTHALRALIGSLLKQDLLHILGGRLPTMTWDILGRLGPVNRLRQGKLPHRELEDNVRIVFSRRPHRKQFPERRLRLPLVRTLSIAQDIDTLEEAIALGATAENPT